MRLINWTSVMIAVGSCLLCFAAVATALIVGRPQEGQMDYLWKAQREEADRRLASVDASDGISMEEAETIADLYFQSNQSCGGVDSVEDDGEYWQVHAGIGYAGIPVEVFHISKRSGAVTSSFGPTLLNPADILK